MEETPEIKPMSKSKGVLLVADDMYQGLTRKDIVPKFTKAYGLSISTVEKWMRAAQDIVAERRTAEEKALVDANISNTMDLANKLGITKERVMQEYAHIALFDARKLYDENGKIKPPAEWDNATAAAVAAIENNPEGFPIKIATNSKKGSLDQISKMMGYVIPEKTEITTNVNIDNGDIIFE